jgi:hypothetical protein
MSDKDDKKDLKIEFAPGCLEQLEDEMSPEDLQEFMDKIKSAIEDGSFFADAVEINMDELEETDPELYETLMSVSDQESEDNTPTIKPTLH